MSSNPQLKSQQTINKIEENESLKILFDRLDVDKDGKVSILDLTESLKHMRLPSTNDVTQKFFTKYDQNKDGEISMNEFVDYMGEQDKALKLSFESLDHNRDGYIDVDELIETMGKLGFNLNRKEAICLIKRMDKDNSMTINFNEFRDGLYMLQEVEIKNICKIWRHSLSMDTGEPASLPDDMLESEIKSGIWWKSLGAGGIAGAVSRTSTAPLDRLKLTFMVYASEQRPIGIIGGVKYMLKEGGLRSLWRGNGVNVVKIIPETAVKFMSYEQIKKLFKSRDEIGMKERFLAGSIAGAISQTVIYPMEVLKTRLSLRKTGQYGGVIDCAKQLYKKEGVACFTRGYLTNLIGIIPYAGIDLAIYESLKNNYMISHPEDKEPGTLVLLACGISSSCSAALASYPLALVRSKQQMNIHIKSNDPSILDYFRQILKTDGIRGLYRGLIPNFLKVAPAVSISYVVYERAKKIMGIE